MIGPDRVQIKQGKATRIFKCDTCEDAQWLYTILRMGGLCDSVCLLDSAGLQYSLGIKVSTTVVSPKQGPIQYESDTARNLLQELQGDI